MCGHKNAGSHETGLSFCDSLFSVCERETRGRVKGAFVARDFPHKNAISKNSLQSQLQRKEEKEKKRRKDSCHRVRVPLRITSCDAFLLWCSFFPNQKASANGTGVTGFHCNTTTCSQWNALRKRRESSAFLFDGKETREE